MQGTRNVLLPKIIGRLVSPTTGNLWPATPLTALTVAGVTSPLTTRVVHRLKSAPVSMSAITFCVPINTWTVFGCDDALVIPATEWGSSTATGGFPAFAGVPRLRLPSVSPPGRELSRSVPDPVSAGRKSWRCLHAGGWRHWKEKCPSPPHL